MEIPYRHIGLFYRNRSSFSMFRRKRIVETLFLLVVGTADFSQLTTVSCVIRWVGPLVSVATSHLTVARLDSGPVCVQLTLKINTRLWAI